MIAYLEGEILQKKANYFIIKTNQGVGYKVFVSNSILLEYQEGKSIQLYTYQHVRENDLLLFGFTSTVDLDLFELLITISGVGPKTALGVFAVATVSDVKSAIINEDSSVLKKVSGIGGKTADRIVLELRNKVDGLVGVDGIKSSLELSTDSDVLDALTSLGYSTYQASEALRNVDSSVSELEEKIKQALKYLS